MANLDRRKVTMVSLSAGLNGAVNRHEAVDYVDVEHLDAYVADARTRWQSVEVGDETDHGPAGENGHYKVHSHMTKKV